MPHSPAHIEERSLESDHPRYRDGTECPAVIDLLEYVNSPTDSGDRRFEGHFEKCSFCAYQLEIADRGRSRDIFHQALIPEEAISYQDDIRSAQEVIQPTEIRLRRVNRTVQALIVATCTCLLLATFSGYRQYGHISRLEKRLTEAEKNNGRFRAIEDQTFASTGFRRVAMRERLESTQQRELLETLMANWGNSSDEGIRLVSNAIKIHEMERKHYIPSIVSNDKSSQWFEHVIRRYISDSAISTDTQFIPVNAEQFPESTNDRVNAERIEYFYGVSAENTLRRMLRIPDDVTIDEATRSTLLQVSKVESGQAWPLQARERLNGRRYVLIQVHVADDDDSQGSVTLVEIDSDKQRVKVTEHAFSSSFAPQSVRKLFGHPDYQTTHDIDVEGKDADEFVVTFPPSDNLEPLQMSFLTFDDNGIVATSSKFGDGLVYLCFDVRVSTTSAEVGFATGGEDAVMKTAITAREYGSKWQRIRIPTVITIGESWRTGLTVTIRGNTGNDPVSVHIRNAYVQPVGGRTSRTFSPGKSI